jgi:hypothetical protein
MWLWSAGVNAVLSHQTKLTRIVGNSQTGPSTRAGWMARPVHLLRRYGGAPVTTVIATTAIKPFTRHPIPGHRSTTHHDHYRRQRLFPDSKRRQLHRMRMRDGQQFGCR